MNEKRKWEAYRDYSGSLYSKKIAKGEPMVPEEHRAYIDTITEIAFIVLSGITPKTWLIVGNFSKDFVEISQTPELVI